MPRKVKPGTPPWLEALGRMAARMGEAGDWREAVEAVLADPGEAPLAQLLQAGADHPTRAQLVAAAQAFKAASEAGDPRVKAAAKVAMDEASNARATHQAEVLRQAWAELSGPYDEWDGGQQATAYGWACAQAERRGVLGAWEGNRYGSHWKRCRGCGSRHRSKHQRPGQDGELCWRCNAEAQGALPARDAHRIPVLCDIRPALRKISGENRVRGFAGWHLQELARAVAEG
jgi:hypothetical protein